MKNGFLNQKRYLVVLKLSRNDLRFKIMNEAEF